MGGWGLQKVSPASEPTSRASIARASTGPSAATLLQTALKDVQRAKGLHVRGTVSQLLRPRGMGDLLYQRASQHRPNAK